MTDAERGKVDPMFLAVEVLGMDFQTNPHEGLFRCFLPQKLSTPLADLDPVVKKRMILWPRGLFKTSAVRVKIIQLILNYPNCRILIGAASLALGKVQLEAVKRVFEQPSDKFRELYPEFCGKKLGNTTRFTVPNRTDFSSPEETVTTSTASSVKAGSHYDFVFIDDLVNDQNYRNPVALEQCWQDYKDFGPLRDPAGYLFVTGTPYSFGDTYERIEESAREEMKLGRATWEISQRTCWSEICSTCGKTEAVHHDAAQYCKFSGSGKKLLLFPQFRTSAGKVIGHTIEFLESELREKGEDFFAMQYECRRLASGLQTFTDQLLDSHTLYHFEKPMMESQLETLAAQIQLLMAQGKTFEQAVELSTAKPGTGVIPLGGWCFAIGDLSYPGDPRKRDKSVFYVIRVVNARLYVIACYSGKWKSSEVGDQVVNILLQHRPRQIWIEGFLGWEAYDTVIRMVATGRGIQALPLEWIPLENQEGAKVVRIGSIQAWFARDKLYIFAGITDYQELRNNLTKFPKLGRHDDHGDCLGLGVNAPHGVALYQSVKESVTLADVVKQKLYPNGPPWERGYSDDETVSHGNGCGSVVVC